MKFQAGSCIVLSLRQTKITGYLDSGSLPLSPYPVIFVGTRAVVHGIVLCQKRQGRSPLVKWSFCSLLTSVRLGFAGSVESRVVLEVYLDMGVKEPFLMTVCCRAICVAP